MTTVFFYFSFPTNKISTSTKTITSSTHPCSSSIENDCIKNNMYSNWEIGSAKCSYSEKCSGIGTCCSGGCLGCNQTCRSKSLTGISCRSYAGEKVCGCTAGGQQISRSCSYVCYNPPLDTYYPGATSLAYISGLKDTNNDKYYVFKATYNTSTFTTTEQLAKLIVYLNNNNLNLNSTQMDSNTLQLNILKKQICSNTAANLLKEPCDEYCKVNKTMGQLSASNCANAWNSFCAYSSNIETETCDPWCSFEKDSSNCKNIYLNYCNNEANYTKGVCRDFYKTQYINNQLSDPVSSLLTTHCKQYADGNGNVLDSNGNIITTGSTGGTYPVTTCACFLPENVYSVFYDKITESNPDLRNFLTVNQCSYPDCANMSAIQPQKITCPDVAITSCIVNNTIGGNVINSNFNIVNNCITQIEKTGSYESNNTNIAMSEPPTEKKKIADIPPPDYSLEPETIVPQIETATQAPLYKNKYIAYIIMCVVGILVCIFILLKMY